VQPAIAGLFCTHTYEAICGGNANTLNARQEQVAKEIVGFDKRAAYEVVKKMAPKLDASSYKNYSDLINNLPMDMKPVRGEVINAFSMRRVEIEEEAEKKYEPAVKKEIERIKRLLVESFREELPVSTQKKLVPIVEELRPFFFSDLVQLKNIFDTKIRYQLAEGKFFGCFNSDTQNAFTYGNVRYLHVCPGWILGHVPNPNLPESSFANLIQVGSHEVAHHVDYSQFPELYQDFRACLLKNYAGLLVPKRGSDEKDPAKILDGHMGEISADKWAVLAAGKHLSKRGGPLSEQLDFLRQAFGPLCGSGTGDGLHPNGEFRINVILGKDPKIRRMMGCSNESEFHVCSL
jgi:hypothetical protein